MTKTLIHKHWGNTLYQNYSKNPTTSLNFLTLYENNILKEYEQCRYRTFINFPPSLSRSFRQLIKSKLCLSSISCAFLLSIGRSILLLLLNTYGKSTVDSYQMIKFSFSRRRFSLSSLWVGHRKNVCIHLLFSLDQKRVYSLSLFGNSY